MSASAEDEGRRSEPLVTLGLAHGAELRTENLCKSFGGKVVLRAVDLEIQRGQMVAIIGGSGSGKTTLLKLMTALEQPDEGRVFVADHESVDGSLVDLAQLDESHLDRLRRHWAIVFQGNALFSGTVFDNIALALREVKGMDESSIRLRVEQAIESVELDQAGWRSAWQSRERLPWIRF